MALPVRNASGRRHWRNRPDRRKLELHEQGSFAMTRHARVLLMAGFFPLLAHAAAPADVAACAVWQRELSFAHSVQRHDAAAFRTHVADDAVFDANTAKAVHGVAAIMRNWSSVLVGRSVHLNWYPAQVVATADGKLAYSSGPYLLEDPAPNAHPRYTIGHFATVWRRGGDGRWRVAFDGGDDGRPADAAAVKAFVAGRQARCTASLAAH
jgi:ketosteroid isomerase-like protein